MQIKHFQAGLVIQLITWFDCYEIGGELKLFPWLNFFIYSDGRERMDSFLMGIPVILKSLQAE